MAVRLEEEGRRFSQIRIVVDEQYLSLGRLTFGWAGGLLTSRGSGLFGRCCWSEWKSHDKFRALSRPGAVGGNCPAVPLRDAPHHTQPKAEPFQFGSAHGLTLEIEIEYPRNHLRADANPGIPNSNCDFLAALRDLHVDGAAFRRIFQSIVHKIGEDLREAKRITF